MYYLNYVNIYQNQKNPNPKPLKFKFKNVYRKIPKLSVNFTALETMRNLMIQS